MNVEAICRKALSETTGTPEAEIVDATQLDTRLGDSLDALELLMQIEEDTGLDLGTFEMPATFGDLIAQVQARANEAAA